MTQGDQLRLHLFQTTQSTDGITGFKMTSHHQIDEEIPTHFTMHSHYLLISTRSQSQNGSSALHSCMASYRRDTDVSQSLSLQQYQKRPA